MTEERSWYGRRAPCIEEGGESPFGSPMFTEYLSHPRPDARDGTRRLLQEGWRDRPIEPWRDPRAEGAWLRLAFKVALAGALVVAAILWGVYGQRSGH